MRRDGGTIIVRIDGLRIVTTQHITQKTWSPPGSRRVQLRANYDTRPS